MQDLSLLTWNEVKGLDKERSILFLTVAPIEEHGVCLPLATDLIEGEQWSKDAMSMIEKNSGYSCYYLPSIPVASASVNSFYGCIHFPMHITYLVIKELLESVINMGFLHVVVVASHADPEHQIAVEKAIRKVNRKCGECVIAPMGAFFSTDDTRIKRDVSDELCNYEKEYPNDFHASWVETSCMLAIDKNYVRPGYEELPASSITGRDMISKKKQLRAMGEYGHMGNPAAADKHIGELLNMDSARFIAEATLNFVKRQDYKMFSHYFLYDIWFMHVGFLPWFGRVKRKKVQK